jgi:uncharacterized protein (DUF1800 family)
MHHASLGKFVLLTTLASLAFPASALDTNSNQQSDIWEAVMNAPGLAGGADAEESVAGTNPFSAASRPALRLVVTNGQSRVRWDSVAGKHYEVRLGSQSPNGVFTPVGTGAGNGGELELALSPSTNTLSYLRLAIQDTDSDGDTLTDAEEHLLGFNATSANTDRQDTEDGTRVQAAWNTANVISVAVLDGELREDWPDPAVLAVRRAGGLKPVAVSFTLTGTAVAGTDYTPSRTGTILIPAGAREAWLSLTPLTDANTEGNETVTVTLQTGAGYTLGAATSASVTMQDAGTLPGAKAAARFLAQASFGPDQDDPADADIVPENVEALMAQGYAAWLEDQFARPVGLHQPFTQWADDEPGLLVNPKRTAWWNRAMGVPSLVPGGPAQAPDPLRQRMAYALSQIFVISDRPETLAVEPVGMANYYDKLVTHAFGNFRDLLGEVSRHPCMGFYLSSAKNRKPDPVLNIHPDENFAREIMQLFTIGLWELNADGTRKLDAQGQPIPTYTNADITELARVFTGFSYDDPRQDDFDGAYFHFLLPMQMWDEQHDLAPKTLLRGVTLPARTASVPDTGAAGLADVNAALDNLFQHPNVGPFIGRLLIQRFTTSNPSSNYVARVAAAFNNNGQGVRGDLRATLRAILLDPEARDPARTLGPTWGKLREPFLRAVNLARAFNASAPNGMYHIDQLDDLLAQEVYHAPSVFNFYLPGYSPPGPLHDAGLVAPEFQILTSVTAITAPNYFRATIEGDFNRWGAPDNDHAVRLNLAHELTLVNDPDALVRRLDLALTGGTLTPRSFQAVRETIARIDSSHWEWENQRVHTAIYLIVNSPEFAVLR